MILYVNGDSHTAAAEAVNQHAFAEDDPYLGHLGRLPHPANLAVSWGRTMADLMKATFKCDAESAASNARILRTTRAWLAQHAQDRRQLLVVIQWSTWEREEWLINGTYYQVNASGMDQVPDGHTDRYKDYIANLDWHQKQMQAHQDIWQFHQELEQQSIRHVFFNGNSWFDFKGKSLRQDWGVNYLAPYDPQNTYDQWLRRHGHGTVAPNSWHFGQAAHAAWARFVLQYCINNRMI